MGLWKLEKPTTTSVKKGVSKLGKKTGSAALAALKKLTTPDSTDYAVENETNIVLKNMKILGYGDGGYENQIRIEHNNPGLGDDAMIKATKELVGGQIPDYDITLDGTYMYVFFNAPAGNIVEITNGEVVVRKKNFFGR